MRKSKKQILASVGLPATAAGEKKFYEMFPTEDSYHQHMAMGGMAKLLEGGEDDMNIPIVTSLPKGFVASKDKPGVFEKTTTVPGDVKPGNVKPVDPSKRTKNPKAYQDMMIDMVKSGKKTIEQMIANREITPEFAKTLAPYAKKEYVQLQQQVTEPTKTNMPLKDSDIINRKQIWTPGNQNQFYDTFIYPDVNHGYSQSTTRYFDKKTGQEVDVSGSFDEKGNYVPKFMQGDPNTVAGTLKQTRINTAVGSPTDNAVTNTMSSGFKWGGMPNFMNPPVLLFGMGGAPCYECGGPHMEQGGGLSRGEDYGSKKKPYPSVDSSDFAGGGRSYPIPTRADAIDALRLAGLHGRSDVKDKVYKKYPDLKKEFGGSFVDDGSYPSMWDGGFFSYMGYGGDPSLANITDPKTFMKMFKGLVKKKEGGSTIPGQTDQSYLSKKNNAFMGAIQNYTQDAIMKETGEQLYNEFLQSGGNYFGRIENPISNLYGMRATQLRAGSQGALQNFTGATADMFNTANPYMTVAAEGIQVLTNPATGKPYSQEEYNELTKYFGKGNQQQQQQNTQDQKSQWYEKPYGQGMTYFPMNYHPFVKFNKEGKAAMEQLMNNPTSNITKFKSRHFGPWGKTEVHFGYKPRLQQFTPTGQAELGPNYSNEELMNTIQQIKDMNQVTDKFTTSPSGKVNPVAESNKMYLKGFNEADQQSAENPIQVMRRAYGGDTYLPKHQTQGPVGYGWNFGDQSTSMYDANLAGKPQPQYPVTTMQGKTDEDIAREKAGLGPKTVTPAQGSGKLLTDYDQSTDAQGKVTMKFRPGFQPEAMANWAMAGMSGISSLMEQVEALKNQKKYQEMLAADNQFLAVQGNRGMHDQWGRPVVDQKVVVEQEGYNTGTPQLGTTGISKFGGMKGYLGLGGFQVLGMGGYAEGGEYYLTESDIEALQKMGGEIEFLDED